jgi:hypothetical protein
MPSSTPAQPSYPRPVRVKDCCTENGRYPGTSLRKPTVWPGCGKPRLACRDTNNFRRKGSLTLSLTTPELSPTNIHRQTTRPSLPGRRSLLCLTTPCLAVHSHLCHVCFTRAWQQKLDSISNSGYLCCASNTHHCTPLTWDWSDHILRPTALGLLKAWWLLPKLCNVSRRYASHSGSRQQTSRSLR